MRSKLVSAFAVLGAVTVLVLAANTVALAANGKGFLLGKSNSASKVTTLARTLPGPALAVKTKRSTDAPFAVNGKGKVTNLNADTLDGLDSTTLAPRTYLVRKTVSPTTSTLFLSLPDAAPTGWYRATYSVSLVSSDGTDLGYVRCLLSGTGPTGSSEFSAEAQHNTDGSAYGYVNGTSLLYRPTASHGIGLQCYTGHSYKTTGQTPVQVSFTRVADVVPASGD